MTQRTRADDAAFAERVFGCRIKPDKEHGGWEDCDVRDRHSIYDPCPRSGLRIGHAVKPYRTAPTWQLAGEALGVWAGKGHSMQIDVTGDLMRVAAQGQATGKPWSPIGPTAILEAIAQAEGI